MFEKSFITDCEGPLTLNDNAFELCAHFIEDGDELFKILSLYDDYLVDEVKKDNYKAGNTLKLILPFFVVENLKNEDLINFSREHIYVVNDSRFLLKYLQSAMNTYIVSTMANILKQYLILWNFHLKTHIILMLIWMS